MARFNPNFDFIYVEPCGCRVTFFAASMFHTSRMLPGSGCLAHSLRGAILERNDLIARAKKALKTAQEARP